jgi:hypothetical protein
MIDYGIGEIRFAQVTTDARRTIYVNSELLGGPEISIIRLHKGKAIGGCWHAQNEHFVVWSGLIEVIIRNGTAEMRGLYGPGMGGTFPKGHSHAMIAMEDSIVSEWGITPAEKQCDQKDADLRRMVDEINTRA